MGICPGDIEVNDGIHEVSRHGLVKLDDDPSVTGRDGTRNTRSFFIRLFLRCRGLLHLSKQNIHGAVLSHTADVVQVALHRAVTAAGGGDRIALFWLQNHLRAAAVGNVGRFRGDGALSGYGGTDAVAFRALNTAAVLAAT